MRTGFIASLVAAPLFAAPTVPTPAQADTAAEQRERAQAERQAELERGQREREQAREAAAARREAAEQREAAARERADLESEIARARRDLEQAAREVARLSAELARPMVQDVQRRFRYTGQRAMLGINIDDTERGVLVAGVTPNGPAADAGIKVGETIIAIDGANLAVPRGSVSGRQSPSELLFAQLANVDPGERVTLRVLSEDGAERDVTVVARELSTSVWLRGVNPPNPQVWRDMRGPWLGVFDGRNPWQEMQLVALTPELGEYFGAAKGLLVVRGPQSDALQLRDGDVILDIGGREPTSPEHALRILGSFQPGEAMKITVMRKQRRQTLEFAMPDESEPQ